MDEIDPQTRLDEAVAQLLEATEALHHAVFEQEDAADLDPAFVRREQAFERVRAAHIDGTAPSVVARASLDRIRAIDEEILARGLTGVGSLRGERQRLNRRRSAIQAHARRERGEPVFVEVKA